jgi:hypothetical protein
MKRRFFTILVAIVLLLTPSIASTRQYLIEDSNTRQLTESELWQWDYETLGYIFNEIFARYGYVFNAGGEYELYFLQRPWYTPNKDKDNQKMVMNKVTTLEWHNYDLIKAIRQVMRDTKNYNTGGMNWRDVIGGDDSTYSGTTSGSSTSLGFTSTSFKANQKFDVYSAPSSFSYRGASGKASVSTNGPVYVAGWENNWLLVMYDTNSGGVRVGYIRESDISGSINASDLNFAYTTKTCSRSVTLTDDPVKGSTDIMQISSEKQVTYLASYNNGTSWAYVETQVDGQTVRGFIPASALE